MNEESELAGQEQEVSPHVANDFNLDRLNKPEAIQGSESLNSGDILA